MSIRFGTLLRSITSSIPLGTYTALILATPVIGKPTIYTIPTYIGTVATQQWYRNSGTGPVAISGATGTTYTPVSADAACFISVHVVLGNGQTVTSSEFPSLGYVFSNGPVLTGSSPGVNLPYYGVKHNGATLRTTAVMRASIGSNYIDSIVGPGTHLGTDFGDLSAYGSDYSTSLGLKSVTSSIATLTPVADTTSATATRPAGNTGPGFFVKSGALYDANGARFRMRGINQVHWDSGPPGIFNSKANALRIFIDFSQPWSTNQPIIQNIVSNGVVPIPTNAATYVTFNGSIASNTLTVTGTPVGYLAAGMSIQGPSGSGINYGNLIAFGTGTGGAGTYILDTTQTVASVSMSGYCDTTNHPDPTVLAAAVGRWVDQVANWKTFDRYSIINLANEWGTTGTNAACVGTIAGNTLTISAGPAVTPYVGQWLSGSGVTKFYITQVVDATHYTISGSAQTVTSSTTLADVTWRESYVTQIARIRAAGYLGTIQIDAPGNGQDGGSLGKAGTLIRDAATVLASDSQSNTIFSLHAYGVYEPGDLALTAASLNSLSTSSGMVFVLGEFGPSYITLGPGDITGTEALEMISTCEACNLGWTAWCWDDNASETTDGYYALCKLAGGAVAGSTGGYQTSNPNDLTTFGKQVLLDPVYGLATNAVKATVFP